jgi:galactofuranosylgalactofuranosylrhamnosyl-N-acetylglucosaminyl-diphospho-decaprenol beta-1,5/1,6-galactofuranosyltransferase
MSQAESMYIRLNEHAQYIYEGKELTLNPGGIADFATYFNQFSVTKWKNYTDVSAIELCLEFEGQGLMTLVLTQHNGMERILLQQEISSKNMSSLLLPLPALSDLPNGLISMRLQSLEGLKYRSGSFVTKQSTKNTICLGIVITAFKRDEYVLPAIRRLTQQLLEAPEYTKKVKLTVIDNGGTLADKDISANCVVIQNRNLGGSGGFARGLLHYEEENNQVTHCLFMDDDASCDSEAIKRTIAFLSFSTGSNTAIAGAMMLENNPTVQHESGAIFDQHCIPLKHGLNLKFARNLIRNDFVEPIMYGAWWFFAFPIKHVEHYPFPFFVRGDDVAFSCANPFEIVTLNGISSLQESFASKESPMTVYLDTRQNVIQYLLFQDLRFPALKILTKFWRTFLKFNCSYHYATAAATCIAICDAMEPAIFWKDNVDMTKKRHQLAPLVGKEKAIPMALAGKMDTLNRHESTLLKILRWSTLNGHLIPAFLMKNRMVVEKGSAPYLRKAFFRKEILVYDNLTKSGFILKHSKPNFFNNLMHALKVSLKVITSAGALHRMRGEFYKNMTRQFWEQEFYPQRNQKSAISNEKE